MFVLLQKCVPVMSRRVEEAQELASRQYAISMQLPEANHGNERSTQQHIDQTNTNYSGDTAKADRQRNNGTLTATPNKGQQGDGSA